MGKIYTALGLMSGTSMDGIDASIIQSDGEVKYKAISNKYFEYKKDLYEDLINLRDKINRSKDLTKFKKELKSLEKEITLFHAKAVNNLIDDTNIDIDFVGFHGQTIFHNAIEKITVQLGNGKLLSQLTKKTVIYDFRQNDLRNGGQGAPLTPIFHKLIIEQNKIRPPVIIVNLGGIANYTFVWQDKKIPTKNHLCSKDTGPGNCLIDQWMRKNSTQLYDKDGKIAKLGKINQEIVDQALTASAIAIKSSYDLKDFDLSLFKKLSLEDGAASLAEYTAETLIGSFHHFLKDTKWHKTIQILICGGGRKNNFLVSRIKKKTNRSVKLIDDYGVNGDFVESQAFGYLAIRSYLKLPISFPKTTGCTKPSTGGVLVSNF